MDNNTTNGDQHVLTYTIGFQTDQTLLKHTAEGRAAATGFTALAGGGGKYFTADNALQLQNAFKDIVISILSGTTTFSSPGIAANI